MRRGPAARRGAREDNRGVTDVEVPALAPRPFREAAEQLRSQLLRAEVVVEAVPAPVRLAPYALALAGEVPAPLRREDPTPGPIALVGAARGVPDDDEPDELASGRFVLLHDPAGQAAWEGAFRAVTLTRAVLETEMATDVLLSGVAWSWVVECLAAHDVPAAALGGTVTRVLSESFGALGERPQSVEVEVRASWTPRPDAAGASLAAWVDLMCTAAGLPPLPAGVVSLPRRLP